MTIDATTVASMPIWWGEDFLMGILFAVAGVIGAAIIIFFYLEELDRLLGKSVSIGQLEDEIKSNKKNADDTDDKENRNYFLERINQAQNQLNEERNFIRSQGIILFLVIGSAIAAMFASSTLEALVSDAGWTGIVGGVGIKKDSEKKRDLRNQIDGEDMIEYEQLKQKVKKEREEDRKKFEQILKKNIDTYYSGYSNAIEDIAKVENTTVEDLFDKLK